MKFIDGIVITKVGGQQVIVAVGQAARCFQGMIKLNDTAAFIARQLSDDTTEDRIVGELLGEYEVTEDAARANVRKVVSRFTELGLLV